MSTLALILAGGRGSRLDILSENRVKPAVPFAGKFRIISSKHLDKILENMQGRDKFHMWTRSIKRFLL